jgi:3-dehydroquinate synthase
MKGQSFAFKHTTTQLFFNSKFSDIKKLTTIKKTIFITDENVFNCHEKKFKGITTIILKSGEDQKNQITINGIVGKLIGMQADKSTILIGVGGGVITDITGYVASIYMRGIEFGFIPTTLLSMVDACIGGKNGINVGIYKNMLGCIKQPSFILYDISFLETLPLSEWQNGFAEIIKHACIKDAAMFTLLQQHTIEYYQKNKKELSALIERNARIKIKFVQTDEFEKGERKLLNFGHTIGHAIENQYGISHGQAISIGMRYAAQASESKIGFTKTEAVIKLLEKYGLPTTYTFNKEKVAAAMMLDKKRKDKLIDFVLLNKIGKAVLYAVSVKDLKKLI